jgi:hypothetical protein
MRDSNRSQWDILTRKEKKEKRAQERERKRSEEKRYREKQNGTYRSWTGY